MSEKKINNSTVARIAGNIAAGMAGAMRALPHVAANDLGTSRDGVWIAVASVSLARAIVAEVERTESSPEAPTP